MAAAERHVKTGLADIPNHSDGDEADGKRSRQGTSVGGSPEPEEEPASPPMADAAARAPWLAAFRAVARRPGGGIRSGQLGDALRLAGFVVTEAEVAQYRAEADPRDEGTIGADTFVALAAKAQREVGGGGGAEGGSSEDVAEDFETLRGALAVFDKPLSGRVKAGDLRRWLTSLGEPIDDADVTKMLEHLVDEQGLLDYAELAHRLVSQ